MIKVSTTGMAVSLKTDLRFPESGQHGHGSRIIQYLKFLLEHRPDKDMTDEQLADLAPWSEKLQSIKNRM